MVQCMKQAIISLFVGVSLLLAPIAHAGGIDCQDDGLQLSGPLKAHADNTQQDDGKIAKAEHVCCCVHVANIESVSFSRDFVPTASRAVIISTDKHTASVVVGPSLKPPSHA